MRASDSKPGAGQTRRFCVLQYSPQPSRKHDLQVCGPPLLLITEDGAGGLGIYVSPDLWRIVHGRDVAFVYDLLKDLPERAERYPDALFHQLCGSVPPLAVGKIGVCGVDDGNITASCAEFVDIQMALRLFDIPMKNRMDSGL